MAARIIKGELTLQNRPLIDIISEIQANIQVLQMRINQLENQQKVEQLRPGMDEIFVIPNEKTALEILKANRGNRVKTNIFDDYYDIDLSEEFVEFNKKYEKMLKDIGINGEV